MSTLISDSTRCSRITLSCLCASPEIKHFSKEPWFLCCSRKKKKKKSESKIAQLCLTLCNPMNCSLPGSSMHGIFQTRVLEWVAISFSRILFKYLLVAAAAKLLQSCPTLCDPIDGRPPGSPVPGILQARTLEWGAISFSNA